MNALIIILISVLIKYSYHLSTQNMNMGCNKQMFLLRKTSTLYQKEKL